jgi:retron-type reverse transcriptase
MSKAKGAVIYEAALPVDISTLDKTDRILLEMSYKAKMSDAEIAKCFDYSDHNIKLRRDRALTILARRALGQ